MDLWRGRWTDQRFGWHKPNVNEHLLKYFDVLKNGKEKLKILFPLCGKSLDLVYCYNQGHTVIGIEGSIYSPRKPNPGFSVSGLGFFFGFVIYFLFKGVPMAVEDLYKAGGLKYEKTFCNEIDGFIYKVFIYYYFIFIVLEEILN